MNNKTALLLLAIFFVTVIAISSLIRGQLLKDAGIVTPINTELGHIVENSIDQNQSQTVDTIFKDKIRVIKFQEKTSLDSDSIANAHSSFLKKNITSPISTMKIVELWLEIPNTTNTNTTYSTVKAQVFIPDTSSPAPLLVYGSGTTGIAKPCAPSLENVKKSNIGNYYNQMVTLSSLGYTVIFPDYTGYHDENSSHPYFIADLEARVMLGVIEALEQSNPNSADFSSIYLAGYSQGGHAALASAVNHEALSPQMKIKGIIGYAPAFDVKTLLIESPRLAPYLVYAYSKYYTIDSKETNEILLPTITANLEKDVLTHCVDTIYSFYPMAPEAIYNPTFLKTLQSNDTQLSASQFSRAVQTNQVNTWKTEIPLLIIQGKTDPIVTERAQLNNLKSFCNNNMTVTYISLADTNHFQTPVRGTHLLHDWIQNIQENRSVVNNCADKTET